MTDENIEDKYPHWKDALFGNHNVVANIRCAIHYVFWHSVYGLIGAIGLIFLGITRALTVVAPIFGPLGGPIKNAIFKLEDYIDLILLHPGTEAIINTVLTFIGFLWVGLIIFFGITNPVELAYLIGTLVLAVVIFIALMYVAEMIKESTTTKQTTQKSKKTLERVGKKATETPGIRRVYGKCPVKIKNHPKWFDNLFNQEEK